MDAKSPAHLRAYYLFLINGLFGRIHIFFLLENETAGIGLFTCRRYSFLL